MLVPEQQIVQVLPSGGTCKTVTARIWLCRVLSVQYLLDSGPRARDFDCLEVGQPGFDFRPTLSNHKPHVQDLYDLLLWNEHALATALAATASRHGTPSTLGN